LDAARVVVRRLGVYMARRGFMRQGKVLPLAGTHRSMMLNRKELRRL